MVAKQISAARMRGSLHGWLVWAFLAVILGHITMAPKNRFIDKDEVFSSMAFGRSHEPRIQP